MWVSAPQPARGYLRAEPARRSTRHHIRLTIPGRWSGLPAFRLRQDPGQISLVDALDGDHQDRRGPMGVPLLQGRAYRFGEGGPRLDDHHGLLAALERALPAVERDHAGRDVEAGSPLALRQGAA